MDPNKSTSYHDLLRSFQQAEPTCQTPRHQKLVYRPKQPVTHKANKQNLTSRSHAQSAHQKSTHQKSEWSEDDVLKEYNEKRKDRQLELTYNKFISYVTSIMAPLTGLVPPQLQTHPLTYLQYMAALKEMALIKDSYQPSSSDAVTKLWQDLTSHGQTCGVFILFVAAILNMRKSEDQGTNKYAYLSKKYAQLRYTRMELFGKIKTTVEEEQFPFTPCISQRSRTLAGSRSKSKQRDRCLAQRSFNNYLQDQEETEHEASIPGSQAGNRRSQILYKMAKERSLQKRRDKKSSEVEYQQSIRELTFHPTIHANNKAPKKKQIQGEQDSINRIVRGRIERQVRKVIHNKGLPYNERLFEKMKRQRYEALQRQTRHQCPYRHILAPQPTQSHQIELQEEAQDREGQRKEGEGGREKKIINPIVLTIQVDQNRCEKLIIDDPSRYKEAAAKFIHDLNLGIEMYEKLIEGVQKALRFQLTQVDEDSCESEGDSSA